MKDRNKLVLDNLGLVGNIAGKFVNAEVEYEDLFQTGCIGLVKASRDYDETLDIKFSTYAFCKIRGEIQRFLRDDGLIKISRRVKAQQRNVYAAKYRLEKELSREPTIQEIAEHSKCKEEDVQCIDATSYSKIKRFSKTLFKSKQGSDISVGDEIMDSDCLEDKVIDKISLEESLNKLNKPSKDILLLKLAGETQKQIAKELSMSQPAVSRYFRKTMISLKKIYMEV